MEIRINKLREQHQNIPQLAVISHTKHSEISGRVRNQGKLYDAKPAKSHHSRWLFF